MPCKASLGPAALCLQGVLAEVSTVKADGIAAAAMKAAETAVMEEMQAAAVVTVGGHSARVRANVCVCLCVCPMLPALCACSVCVCVWPMLPALCGCMWVRTGGPDCVYMWLAVWLASTIPTWMGVYTYMCVSSWCMDIAFTMHKPNWVTRCFSLSMHYVCACHGA